MKNGKSWWDSNQPTLELNRSDGFRFIYQLNREIEEIKSADKEKLARQTPQLLI